ncbi:MAG: 50S ribosomal protein L24e [Candidatus Marsarchaeota archaeon]|jgi:large subunit ribosomal protein L24e|nr:50S ribosomal protein L24e [Candidatus Marsarchaeota archaeon]MCL5115356.1 50S ribosomal protein L24e [Candidatus Marsarchaeota archaeon]
MKCTYCSSNIKKGTGIMYVHKIGTVSYFCSGRCYKNAILVKRKQNRMAVKKVERKAV